MSVSDYAFSRFVDVLEKIANNGIDIYVRAGDDKMAVDLATMKITEGLESIACAIESAQHE